MFSAIENRFVNPDRGFALLIGYRWISLLPPLVALLLAAASGELAMGPLAAFLLAAAFNLAITFFYSRLNPMLVKRPALLLLDLALAGLTIALTGGWSSPYYLYALSPLLIAAFFFQLRGALLAATFFLPVYIAAVAIAYGQDGRQPSWLVMVITLVGAYLLSGTFGLVAALVSRLQSAGNELGAAHRDLQVIHDLTVSLQSAADVTEVEQRVLEAVTDELGFEQAVVALVNPDTQTITSWMGRGRDGALPAALAHSAELPLAAAGGLVCDVLLAGSPRLSVPAPLTADETINEQLSFRSGHIFPLVLRDNPVGVLLVEASDHQQDSAHFRSLQSIANQAAVSLGTTMMCINRAQRMAVQEERIRIAHDIHDTVSQSLFGIVYTLDGCLKLLPEQPEAARPELERVLNVAEETRAEIRKSIMDIWPSELTAMQFEEDLRKFTAGICQMDHLQLDFSVEGDFGRLSSRVRRSLYRISQEALANVAHHALANEAHICLNISLEQVVLKVSDDGRGFDVVQALRREVSRERFGLWGMQERARSLGGCCQIESRPGAGTSVTVEVPLAR